jgi:hypothetical protein
MSIQFNCPYTHSYTPSEVERLHPLVQELELTQVLCYDVVQLVVVVLFVHAVDKTFLYWHVRVIWSHLQRRTPRVLNARCTD